MSKIYPACLYKFFKEEKWADAFVARGECLFRDIRYFREINCDVRRDDSEGRSRNVITGRLVQKIDVATGRSFFAPVIYIPKENL